MAAGPYPTNVANGNKTIPVTTAYWGSRYMGDLATTWDTAGNLLNYTGSPVLMGGSSSVNAVAGGCMACLPSSLFLIGGCWLSGIAAICVGLMRAPPARCMCSGHAAHCFNRQPE